MEVGGGGGDLSSKASSSSSNSSNIGSGNSSGSINSGSTVARSSTSSGSGSGSSSGAAVPVAVITTPNNNPGIIASSSSIIFISKMSAGSSSKSSDKGFIPSTSLACPKRRKLNPPGPASVRGEKEGLGLLKSSGPVASSAVVHSWQETKASIKERTTCLVNNERLSDIKFLVGPLEAPIFGHKTILSASSPYFENLFFGPMATKEPIIRIPDIEPEVFLSFLKYLYTDEFDDSMDDSDAMMLLKPAKIYIVPHLANKCARLLINKMSPDNVFLIYNHAITFDEPELALVCLRFLDRQIDRVIQTEEFLEIDRDTLCTLLERENLRINEGPLFKAVMNWTESECQRRDLEITPENQRDVLGNALYLIRFPAMTREEFSIDVVPKGILNKDEIISVFMNLCISNDKKQYRPETPFFTDRRVYRPKLHYVNRFSDVLSKVIHYTPHVLTGENVYNSSCKFRTDQRVFLHGVGIYAVSSTINGLKFVASASLFKNADTQQNCPPGNCPPNNPVFGQLLGSKTVEGSTRSYDFRMPFQIIFEPSLEVRRGEDYVIMATLKVTRDTSSVPYGSLGFGGIGGYGNQIDAYYGTKPLAIVNTPCNDGIKVNFAFPSLPTNETFSAGQIPQLIISV